MHTIVTSCGIPIMYFIIYLKNVLFLFESCLSLVEANAQAPDIGRLVLIIIFHWAVYFTNILGFFHWIHFLRMVQKPANPPPPTY